MSSLFFRVDCDPPIGTAQQKGIRVVRGVPIFYKKQVLKDAEEFLSLCMMQYRPRSPIPGPLSIEIEVDFRLRQSDQRLRESNRFPHTQYPDIDNWAKALLDLLVHDGFIEDDNEVSELILRKYRSIRPGFSVRIRQIDTRNKTGELPGLAQESQKERAAV